MTYPLQTMFGIFYVEREGATPELCEVDGGECFEAFPSLEAAQARAVELCAFYAGSMYIAAPIPAGQVCWNPETDSRVMAACVITEVFAVICEGALDQICETRALANKEKRDLDKMGCGKTVVRAFPDETAVYAYFDKKAGL